jgi:undecaprenyl-diphosphatase
LNLIDSVILGLVQGITEFLPVSSSGHLTIVGKLLGIEPNIPFDILLHFATLTAVILFFYKDILDIIKAFLFNRKMSNPDLRLGIMVIVASIPTALIGFTLKDKFEELFSSLLYVGIFLMLTAVLILLAEKYGKAGKDVKKLSFIDSLVIGIAQGCAIAPGLSRSGTTISASLLAGLERPFAARFSFLLSIPAILGASIFKAKAIVHGINSAELIGFFVAAVSGYIAIYLFMSIIKKHNIKGFAYYCIAAGMFSILLSFR